MPKDHRPAPVFETRRLRLRPYEPDDLDRIAEMYADPEVTALTLLGRRDRGEVRQLLFDYRSFNAELGYGMLAIEDRLTGDYLGEAGTVVAPFEGNPLALRYALVRAAWGRGFATEASAAIVDDVFGRLEFDKLTAGVVPANTASIRVMDKLGFAHVSEREVGGQRFEVYRMTREDWQARQPA